MARAPRPDAATTVQLPTFGVAISAEGVLSLKTFEDPTGQLRAAQVQAAKAQLAANLKARSPLRKVSLLRLEAAVRQAILDGKKPDPAMTYLAGLQRLQYVFYLPQSHDIVIAGPAEGFAADLSGRVCGLTSGRPAGCGWTTWSSPCEHFLPAAGRRLSSVARSIQRQRR